MDTTDTSELTRRIESLEALTKLMSNIMSQNLATAAVQQAVLFAILNANSDDPSTRAAIELRLIRAFSGAEAISTNPVFMQQLQVDIEALCYEMAGPQVQRH